MDGRSIVRLFVGALALPHGGKKLILSE